MWGDSICEFICECVGEYVRMAKNCHARFDQSMGFYISTIKSTPEVNTEALHSNWHFFILVLFFFFSLALLALYSNSNSHSTPLEHYITVTLTPISFAHSFHSIHPSPSPIYNKPFLPLQLIQLSLNFRSQLTLTLTRLINFLFYYLRDHYQWYPYF